MIEVKGLSKKYGNIIALDDVYFNLSQGEIVGFLGPNGAGKSTTMKILSGILMADAGSVSIFGNDIHKQPLKAKAITGYLPEDNPLYENMYVKEYLAFVASMYSLKDRQVIDELIEKVGLVSEYKKKIYSLSKGNKQRVGLAQSLINDPSFLILDEPTGGLDPNQQIEIQQLLLEISTSKIILFSSHILQEVANVCSRYIIIDKGRIVYNDLAENTSSVEDIFYNLTHVK